MNRLPSRSELVEQGYIYGMVMENFPLGDPAVEWMRTAPDVQVYLPKVSGGNDNDNCVLAVTPAPGGEEIIAVWTQSSCETWGDNRIMISRSNNGVDWQPPEFVIGARHAEEKQSSWGMPMWSKSGRLYLFLSRKRSRMIFTASRRGYWG